MENIKSLAKVCCWAFLLSACLVVMRPSEVIYEPDEIEIAEVNLLQKGGVMVLGHLISHLSSEI